MGYKVKYKTLSDCPYDDNGTAYDVETKEFNSYNEAYAYADSLESERTNAGQRYNFNIEIVKVS